MEDSTRTNIRTLVRDISKDDQAAASAKLDEVIKMKIQDRYDAIYNQD